MDPSQLSERQTAAVLFRLLQRNDEDGVKDFVRKLKEVKPSFNVNSLIVKKSGDCVLHVCATLGYIELIKYFIEKEGANVEQINLDGKTALHDAAQFSQLEIVKYLLEVGANVNVVKRADWTSLMLACTKQDVDVIRTLVTNGANLTFVNKDGWTCVHLAAREGNVEALSYLLDSCGNHTSRSELKRKKSRNGRQPIHTAVMHGHLEAVRLLAERSTKEQLNEEDTCGTTPLMDASRFGFTEIAAYLIEIIGLDPTATNSKGTGLLHVAAEADQAAMIEFLVERYHLDVNAPSALLGLTPIHWASKEGNLAAVSMLQRLGANSTTPDSKGRTAADLAGEFNHHYLHKFFLESSTTPPLNS